MVIKENGESMLCKCHCLLHHLFGVPKCKIFEWRSREQYEKLKKKLVPILEVKVDDILNRVQGLKVKFSSFTLSITFCALHLEGRVMMTLSDIEFVHCVHCH